MGHIAREHGLSEVTFCAGKNKCAGASVAELTRLNQQAEENSEEVRRVNYAERERSGAGVSIKGFNPCGMLAAGQFLGLFIWCGANEGSA